MVVGGGRVGSIARFSYHHASCRRLCSTQTDSLSQCPFTARRRGSGESGYSRQRKNYCGTVGIQWPAHLGPQENTTQDAQKVRPARPRDGPNAGATPSQGKSGQVAGSTGRGCDRICSRDKWVVRWLVIRDAAQWSEQPEVRRRGSCANSFVARFRAMPISSLFSAVLRSVATIRWVGSERRILRGWHGALPGEGKVDPDERSGHIGDDVKD